MAGSQQPGGLGGIGFADYHRTVVAYHGTSRATAEKLVAGKPFAPSENEDDWLGHGVYFWEYAPRQAWWWCRHWKHKDDPAVVGAVIRLGHCFDLLDPENVQILRDAHDQMEAAGVELPENGNQHKLRDCAVFNYFYEAADQAKRPVDTSRGVYVPVAAKRRIWRRSWIYEQAHIQVCVRNPASILAAWHVREDGGYGLDDDPEE